MTITMGICSKLRFTVICAVAVMAIIVSDASAGARIECNAIYTNATLRGGVVVNLSGACILDNVTVNGGLEVNGGSLSVTHSTIYGGWLIADRVIPINYFCSSATTRTAAWMSAGSRPPLCSRSASSITFRADLQRQPHR